MAIGLHICADLGSFLPIVRRPMQRLRPIRVWLIALVAGVLPGSASAQSAQTLTLHWDPNPPADLVTAYSVCVGTASLTCNIQRTLVLPIQTQFTLATPTPGTLYYFSVKALSLRGTSAPSAEVAASIPSLAQPATQFSTVNVPIKPFSLSVSDPDGSGLQFSHSGLPFGLSLNTTTGQITGTPTGPGNFNVTVFVSDGVATVSRSFVWSIASADVIPPAVAITSHISGQTLTSSNVTIAGTATDNGAGSNGISKVTVNGMTASGGTVTGNGMVNWNRSLTLNSGANTITVQATDGASNTRTVPIALNLNLTAPAMTAALSPSLTSPRRVNTSITWNARSTGGIQPVQYKFLVRRGSNAAQVVRNWNTWAAFTWKPSTAGTYTVIVWVRNAGVTADVAQASAQTSFVITTTGTTTTAVAPATRPMTAVALATGVSSQQVGGQVTLSATGYGGATPYQYRFWAQHSTGSWVMLRDYGPSASYVWTPSQAGSYQLAVWARSAGSTQQWDVYAEQPFSVVP